MGQLSLQMIAQLDTVALKVLPEKVFQAAVMAYAQQRAWHCVHFIPAYLGKRYITAQQGNPGFVDCVMARHGTVHHWELKREEKHKGRASKEQREWLKALGGQLLRPSDAAWIIEQLQEDPDA